MLFISEDKVVFKNERHRGVGTVVRHYIMDHQKYYYVQFKDGIQIEVKEEELEFAPYFYWVNGFFYSTGRLYRELFVENPYLHLNADEWVPIAKSKGNLKILMVFFLQRIIGSFVVGRN